MKFPFKIMEQGLEISFQRVSCLEIWEFSGSMASPEKHLRLPCRGRWRWMGRDSDEKAQSQRVGVCRKHGANDFTEETLQEWRNNDRVKSHIAGVYEYHRRIADRQSIQEELGLSKYFHYGVGPGDRVMFDAHTDTYWVQVKGLTREAAIQIYKMADAIRAETAEEG